MHILSSKKETCFSTVHEEICLTEKLSVIAGLSPWFDHNQSPRHMHQCQTEKHECMPRVSLLNLYNFVMATRAII
jgi:hypothetical protein